MIREIKFRGKGIEGIYKNKWIYGYYFKTQDNKNWITVNNIDGTYADVEVIPKTVGQYISILDKQKKEIYEGDKIKIKVNNSKYFIEEIYWNEYRWYPFGERVPPNYSGTILEIIGNIHE